MQAAGDTAPPRSIDEALAMLHASLDHLASTDWRTLGLGRPYSGTSLPLDLGSSDHIPGYLRRAVILRDTHCQWPGGCDRPASRCEPHHPVPRSEGGETSLRNLALYCKVHHHHFIHRLGWKIIPHPDGTTTAISPHGKAIHSHGPRTDHRRGREAGGQGPAGSTGPPGNRSAW